MRSKTQETYYEYKEQRTKFKNLVVQAKKETWTEFDEIMENNKKGKQKLFYKVLRNLRKVKQVEMEQIKDKKGELLTETYEIRRRWKKHFEKILNTKTKTRISNEEVEVEETDMEGREEEGDITEEQLVKAINKIKNGKAAGHGKMQ